jgi:hypothetical protein
MFRVPSSRQNIAFFDMLELAYITVGVSTAPATFRRSSTIEEERRNGVLRKGFSDLILELFGREVGAHARSPVGMAELPFDFPVEIEGEVMDIICLTELDPGTPSPREATSVNAFATVAHFLHSTRLILGRVRTLFFGGSPQPADALLGTLAEEARTFRPGHSLEYVRHIENALQSSGYRQEVWHQFYRSVRPRVPGHASDLEYCDPSEVNTRIGYKIGYAPDRDGRWGLLVEEDHHDGVRRASLALDEARAARYSGCLCEVVTRIAKNMQSVDARWMNKTTWH